MRIIALRETQVDTCASRIALRHGKSNSTLDYQPPVEAKQNFKLTNTDSTRRSFPVDDFGATPTERHGLRPGPRPSPD